MSNEGGDDCAICLQTMETHTHRLEGCGHVFHSWCILKVWREKPKEFLCPLCRCHVHTRMERPYTSLKKRAETHQRHIEDQLSLWRSLRWLVAFASSFWLARVLFGSYNEITNPMRVVFVLFTVVYLIVFRPSWYPRVAVVARE